VYRKYREKELSVKAVCDMTITTTRQFQCAVAEVCAQPSAAKGGGAAAPSPRNWVHKKIPGCAVELNTQNCTWFGSQISLITKMSFREAICPLPRITHQGLCPWTPQGDFRSPDPLCPPLPNPGYATGLIRNDANIVSASKTQH